MRIAYFINRYSKEILDQLVQLKDEAKAEIILVQIRKEVLPEILLKKRLRVITLSGYLKEKRAEDIFMIDSYLGLTCLDKVKPGKIIYLKSFEDKVTTNPELDKLFRTYTDSLPIPRIDPSSLKDSLSGQLASGNIESFSEKQRNIYYFIVEKIETIVNIEKGYVWTREQYMRYKNLNIFKLAAKKISKIFKGA